MAGRTMEHKRRRFVIATLSFLLVSAVVIVLTIKFRAPLPHPHTTPTLDFVSYTTNASHRSCASFVFSNSTAKKIQVILATVTPYEHGPVVHGGQIINNGTVLSPGQSCIFSPYLPQEHSTFEVMYSAYSLRDNIVRLAQRCHVVWLVPEGWKQSRATAGIVNAEIPTR